MIKHRFCTRIPKLVLILSLVFNVSLFHVSAENSKPNVVIVFSDQLATWALSCYGGTEIKTPNIDALAKNGVQFYNAYCLKAVCTPSRGSMLTGLYPFANESETNQMLLNTKVETYADVLNANGYQTAYMGKWHLAGHMGPNQNPNWNPDINGGFKDATYMYNNGHWKNIVDRTGTTPVVSTNITDNPSEYGTDWLFNKGFAYIDAHKNQTFALVVSPPDPHPGLKVRAPYNTMVDPTKLSYPKSLNPENVINQKNGSTFSVQARSLNNKAQYLGMVLLMDDYIGKLVEKLKAVGIYDNTIIILTADHGEMMGAHGYKGKAVPYQEAYNIPFIVCAPKLFKSKVVSDLYSNIDFKSTLLGLLKLDEQPNQGYDKSFMITGTKSTTSVDENIYFDFAKGGNDEGEEGGKPHVGVVTPEYWLAVNFNKTNNELTGIESILLFDRKNDPLQLNNLYGTKGQEKRTKELLKLISDEFKRVENANVFVVELIDKEINR